jgi:alpha-aminoadipate carrier protein LysW
MAMVGRFHGNRYPPSWFISALPKKRNVLMSIVCPECDNPLDIDVDDVEEGEIIQCEECGTDLEVVSSDPLELVPVDEEGYSDEDEDLPLDDEEDE